MSDLQLEVNDRALPNTGEIVPGRIFMTPPIDEDFWYFRVRLAGAQAIVGFPKYATIGIGFAQEEDWNTNLPFTISAAGIYEHVKHNKGNDEITDEQCLTAIEMIREAARAYKGLSDEEWVAEQARMERPL